MSSRLGLFSTTQRHSECSIIGWLLSTSYFFFSVCKGGCMCVCGVCVWSTGLGHLRFRVLLRLALFLLSQLQKPAFETLGEGVWAFLARFKSIFLLAYVFFQRFETIMSDQNFFFSGVEIQSASPFRHTQNSCSAMHSRKPSQNMKALKGRPRVRTIHVISRFFSSVYYC